MREKARPVTKRYPVSWGRAGYFLGHATTAAGALRLIRKVSPSATKAVLSRGKKPCWSAAY